MAEIRDSSGLFSLRRLMDLERDRVAADQRRRREEAIRFQADQERLERETEKLRAIEAERRRVREEATAREAELRAAALKQVELERASAEIQGRNRLEILEKQQEHERAMARLREQSRRRSQRVAVLASLGLALSTALGSLALYFGRLKPEQERSQAESRELIRVAEARATYAEQVGADGQRRNELLAAEVLRLKHELARTRATATPDPAAPARPAPGPERNLPQKPPCPKDRDPLNPCLG